MSDLNSLPKSESDEVNLLEYFDVIIRRRKTIFLTVLVFFFLSAIITLVWPKSYSSKTVLMPPNEGIDFLGGLSSSLGLEDFGSILGGGSDEAFALKAILESRTMAIAVIDSFKLKKRYRVETMDEVLDAFSNKVDVELNDDGTIGIKAEASTGYFHLDNEENEAKLLCANIANFMVNKLDGMNQDLKSQRAKYERLFIENRFTKNKNDLIRAEEDFKVFSEEYGIISPAEQINALITTTASLESEIAIKEIEYNVLKGSLDHRNSKIKLLENEVLQLQKKLKDIKTGKNITENSKSIMPSFENAPDLSLKFIRLKRDVEVQNLLYRFFAQQYEQAKIQESKDTPTIQILDAAVAPEKRNSPMRTLIVLIASFLGGMVGIIISLIKENVSNLAINDKQGYDKIRNSLIGLKKDTFGLKTK